MNGLAAFNKGYWFDPKTPTNQIFCIIADKGWFASWLFPILQSLILAKQGLKTHALIITVEDNRERSLCSYSKRKVPGWNTVLFKKTLSSEPLQ